ncbi:MAG: SRPBCC family protein [Proteobacteria bacterium]|nr:SRPBCC family protein [Pseudomonadota bacterium]MBS0555466.1 SRPBCC family protein [Pseudomonadota bacterium]
MKRLAFFLVSCLSLMANAWPADGGDTAPVDDADVRVERAGDHFTVDMVAHAPVDIGRAWAVLTAFERMAAFVPNLHQSEVVGRDGGVIRVRQAGRARYGPFSAEFDFMREFTLKPQREIRAHSVGGNVRRMDSVMTLDEEGAGTRLQYHAEVEPGFWLPPLIGPAFVRHETAEQFSAMIREMTRAH